MLTPTSRIELENGIRFYEQDILFDDYIYTGNLLVNLVVEYNTPGIGIALISSEGYSLKDKEEVLLFRLGYKEASVIYKNKDTQKTLATYNVSNIRTGEQVNISLSKVNDNYKIYIENKLAIDFDSTYEFNSYNIGYYSSGGNALKNINVASAIPFGWVVNMSNTNYGYINFEKNGFELNHCKGQAEIEQIEIDLKPGKYYLKYETEDSDIVPYVFIYNDNNLYDDEKNLLSVVDKSFKLDYSERVNLKFKGSKGKIKKIQITTEKENDYIKTTPETGRYIDIGGSYINVRLESLKHIQWTGTIFSTASDFHKNPTDYAVISDGEKNFGLYDLNIILNKEYKYEYNVLDKMLSIYSGADRVFNAKITSIKYIMTIFKNISAVINSLKLTTLDGTVIEDTVQDTAKKYVPAKISSPIIVTNKNDIPLDLSSSIRTYKDNLNNTRYLFTNVEREIFPAKYIIKLSKAPSLREGTTIVYGINKNAITNKDKILTIPNKDMINAIDDYATMYDVLFEKDLRSYDKELGEIRINDVSDYKEIVVDYLKRDSYAINFIHKLTSYEVDISIDKDDEANVLYDNIEKAQDKTNVLLINSKEYIQTNIIPSDSCYVTISNNKI